VAGVIRDLNNLIEMEVAINGRVTFFRGQTSGVAGKVFQACGVALPPRCAHAETYLSSAQAERKRVTRPFSKLQLLEMGNFRQHGVEDELESRGCGWCGMRWAGGVPGLRPPRHRDYSSVTVTVPSAADRRRRAGQDAVLARDDFPASLSALKTER